MRAHKKNCRAQSSKRDHNAVAVSDTLQSEGLEKKPSPGREIVTAFRARCMLELSACVQEVINRRLRLC